jgi:hypothetical protein
MCAAKESQTKEDEGLSAPVLRHLHGERDDLTQVSRWTELLTFILRQPYHLASAEAELSS